MKWKYLRDQFRKELNKIPISRSGDECNTYKPSWPYFEMLLFLKDQLTAKQMSGNLCYTQSMDDQDNNETERQIMDENETNNDDLSNRELQESASTARENTHQTNISRKRKRSNYNTSEVNAKLLEIEEQKLKLLAKDCSNDEEKSDDYHFLISLLPLFKDFSNIQKLRVRTKFQQILMEEISQQTNLSAASSPGFGYTSNDTSSGSQYHNLTMPTTTEQYHSQYPDYSNLE